MDKSESIVTFDQIKLSSITMFYPDFENCRFENCNLKRTEFNGAILNHVQFIGLVSDVKFRGRYVLRDVMPPEDFDPERMYQLNPMIVDFSEAEITYSMFTDACDLIRVILPPLMMRWKISAPWVSVPNRYPLSPHLDVSFPPSSTP